MFPLRRLSLFARLALAAWLLSLGAALAAPALQRPAMELACVGGAMKLVVVGDDGAAPPVSALDCPLCLPALAPPPAAAATAGPPAPAFAQPAGRVSSPPSLRPAGPPPARGPPGFPDLA